MDVRLLGPLELHGGAGLIDAGPAKQRCVLAALALSAGRQVPINTLVRQVWSGHEPNAARNSLYAYVARLRGALRAHGVTIHCTDVGYLIDIGPDQVDVHRFTALSTAGLRARDPSALWAAMDLWRGEPLANLSSTWADEVRADLTRRYLEVLVEWATIGISTGRTSEVVEHTGRALTVHPHNEQLIGCHLRALHAAGRTSEGLAYYETARQRLRDELDAAPSYMLRQVHSGLLCEESAQRPAAPAQLPRSPRGFVGREHESRWLGLHRDDHVVVVSGAAGIGKTALALTWGHRAATRFPDGQLYADLRTEDQPVEILTSFLRAMGVPPDDIPPDEPSTARLYRSIMAERDMLVVLDNASSAAQVRSLLPREHSGLVLITSRHSLAELSVPQLMLGCLHSSESLELLRVTLGRHRIDEDRTGARELAGLCHGNPLALRITASNLLEYPDCGLSAYARELRTSQPSILLETTDGSLTVEVANGQ